MSVNNTPSPEQLNNLLARARSENLDAVIIQRLQVILHFAEHQYSISETCRQFGISRSTFHRWMERFDANDLSTLADKSHEPLTFRQSAIEPAVIEIIRRYRMRYPQMGKERIAELLFRDHGQDISPSSVGRVIERECLYFADTPLHWKKRMEHQRANGQSDLVAPPEPVHVQVTAEQEFDETTSPESSTTTWSWVRRFVIVSSVITNVAFVSILVGMALMERFSSHPTVPNTEAVQQQVLHAAPSQNFIP